MRSRSPSSGCLRGVPALSAVLVALVSLLSSGTAVAGAPVAAPGTRFTRSIEVPAVGWVRVPLDPEILREAAPAGGSLQLFGPEGEEVPFRRVLSAASGEWAAAHEVSETLTPSGWLVVLALAGPADGPAGAAPGRHDRVRLELETAPPEDGSVRVEGSDDGSSWQLLAVGRPDRSVPSDGPGAAAVTLDLAYPATADRFLRLLWPAGDRSGRSGQGGAAGTAPASAGLHAASVETVPARSLGVAMPRPVCHAVEAPAVGPRVVCTLPVASAAGHLRRLDLTVAARHPVGYRLLVPEEGRWEPVATGVWSSPLPETPHSLGLDLDLPRPAEPLRLELYGEGEDFSLARAEAELGAEALVFRARRAGRHTLAYGAGVYGGSGSAQAGAQARNGVRPPAGVELRRIEPGPEESEEVSGGGPPLPESAGPAPSVQFLRRWAVQAEAPVAGGLYRLPLADDVYAAARPDLGDLRLLAGDLQVPYVRWRPAEPFAVTTVRGAMAKPVPAGAADGPPASSATGVTPGDEAAETGVRRVGIDLGARELPLSALVVHAPAARFRRRVRVLAVGPATPGRPPSLRPLSPWLDWSCAPHPPLSCRLSIALGSSRTSGGASDRSPAGSDEEVVRQASRLVLEIDRSAGAAQAEAATPATLDLELWRRQDLLLFPWPPGDAPLRLSAGAEDLGAPDYDLAARRDELLARPSRRAEMVAPYPDGHGLRAGGWVAGWTVGVTLALALGLLLFLLGRILAERDPSPPSGPPPG